MTGQTKAERIVTAICAMHVPYISPRSGRAYCKECESAWPCATNEVIAIIGASEAE